MSKKNRDQGHDDEKDLEEDDEETERDEDEDEEDHSPAPRTRARPAAGHHDAHDDHGHGDHDDDEDEEDLDDPYWWTPHAVMGVLVLLGVLGFFGVFNKILAPFAAKPAGGTVAAAPAHGDAHASGNTAPANAATPPAQREEFGAKHLLVQYKGAMRAPATVTRTEEEAKTRAEEAHKKAKGGAKFEDLVKDYSDEPGAAARGGDLGKFRKGQMVPEFQTAVEKLKVGEVSDLVKTAFGYHVILRTQ